MDNHNCIDLIDQTQEFLIIENWTFLVYVCFACKKHFIVFDKIKSAKRIILEVFLNENNKWYLKIEDEKITTNEQIKSLMNSISLHQVFGCFGKVI